MHCIRYAVVAIFLIVSAGISNIARAQSYPSRPIHIIATDGGSSDTVFRLIGPKITENLHQPVVIESRPSSVVLMTSVAKAPPDGYTLIATGSILWLLPFLEKDVPYDPINDFSPISIFIQTPTILLVNPSLPVKSIRELIALAKDHPNDINYASAGSGTSSHLAAEMLKSMAGIKLTRVPYKNASASMTDVMSGQVQMIFTVISTGLPLVKSGKLRTLGVTSAQPTILAPGVPTIAATGLPGYEYVSTNGLFAPAKTPVSVVETLNEQIVHILAVPDVKQKLVSYGVEPVSSSPEQLRATVKSEIARMGQFINANAITE